MGKALRRISKRHVCGGGLGGAAVCEEGRSHIMKTTTANPINTRALNRNTGRERGVVTWIGGRFVLAWVKAEEQQRALRNAVCV